MLPGCTVWAARVCLHSPFEEPGPQQSGLMQVVLLSYNCYSSSTNTTFPLPRCDQIRFNKEPALSLSAPSRRHLPLILADSCLWPKPSQHNHKTCHTPTLTLHYFTLTLRHFTHTSTALYQDPCRSVVGCTLSCVVLVIRATRTLLHASLFML